MSTSESLLRIKGLKVMFPSDMGFIRAVEGIDMEICKGECAALVGESGCGKTVASLSIMKLLQTPPALISVKEHIFDGIDIAGITNSKMQSIRGSSMSMVFQDAMTSLNPVMTVGKQLDEALMEHKKISREEAKKESIEILRRVGVPAPEQRYRSFPHELSGGMRQRVLIGMAFSCNPKLMIADEPTTALDVTIQAQILELLMELKRQTGMALLLITHDLSVVANMADKVYVMYSGKIVEKGNVQEVFKNPMHPYTIALIKSVPRLSESKKRFVQIPDTVPHPIKKPEGCYFHPRCGYATEICRKCMPVLETQESGRQVRCWNFRGVAL
ncbi:MAG: ABC transporter ATP-binding protein [Eubacteriales bacterium]|nr:ABC transporter ATP-binding protein [Eubacteriales bacterium]